MMKLRELLNGLDILETNAELDSDIREVRYDSRLVESGDLFIAVTGAETDGHKYIPMAREKGAACVLCEITAITRKNRPTGTVTLLLSPSRPSVIFTALTVPTITKAANTRYTIHGSTMWVFQKGIYRLGLSIPSYRIRHRNATAAASCKINFCGAVRPVFWWCFTF